MAAVINVSVIYAAEAKSNAAAEQVELTLQVEPNCTVAMAIKRSGILKQFPELKLAIMVVGIYGKKVALDASLRDKDRIEILRPLKIDPKDARRARAAKV